MAEREFRFEQKMSDAEAMMWNIEHDPRMSASFGSVVICDRPLDADHLRKKITDAVAAIPRLRDRVAPVLGRLAPPVWIPDSDFDLDYHYRHLALPAPGTERQLFDLCTKLLAEPFDRTRPLWLFVAVDGLSDGRGALFTKLHHTVADGEGAIRLSERYMDLERDADSPPEVDLDEVIAAARATQAADTGDGFGASLLRTGGHTLRRFVGVARRTAGEVALAAADPQRLSEAATNLRKAVESARDQLSTDTSPGSPLWVQRSRGRYFDTLEVPFEEAKTAAKALGGSLNDFFVTGAAMAAARYHEAKEVEAPYFNTTFVVSTRADRSAGGNAFTPTKVRLAGHRMKPAERFAEIQEAMGSRRGEVTGGADLMGAVSGLANLLPTSVVTDIARGQAGAIDFATSNVRGAPIPVYVGGAKVVALYPMGPVAGTAWNITLMSYAGSLDIGVHMDPASVEDADLLMASLRAAYEELMVAGGVDARIAGNGSPEVVESHPADTQPEVPPDPPNRRPIEEDPPTRRPTPDPPTRRPTEEDPHDVAANPVDELSVAEATAEPAPEPAEDRP